ncbi:Hermansky-Pudlak syndrome 5 protein [Araneus ventricosus]|uniref:Hermansky-Pudlak syndrome 5 protein n=1 Tax=Araneus ventricosus TaxID=182803 RepID=A0A4Y2A7R1_ARAVE|nr:Hermansky-Pudlak syndrome 5 protein [Araneus ventricosus]
MASGGIAPPRVSYILAELEDVDAVFVPIKTASRVKYTCFDVSRHYIVFGTNAGGVVFLQHDTLSYIKTVTAKEGPVCQVALSPDENVVAFATSRGVTVIMEHNAERGAAQAQRLQISFEHRGAVVTAIQWNVSSSKVYIGDDKGRVSVISVSTSRTRNIFQVPTTTLMKLDSKVVQLDFAQDHLLVSTLTRCHLCDTNKELFMTIGKKMRDGEYGACFYPGVRSVDPCTIYSARPGSRLWEVDIKGNVCCTHQFKAALAIKPEKLYTFRNEINMDEEDEEYKPQATNFQKLLLIWPSTEDSPFVFTWNNQRVFIFDPKRAEVILWNEDIKGVKDAKCLKTDVFVHFVDGRFAKYTLMTVEQGVCRLYQQGLAIHGAQLLLLKKSSLCSSRLNIYVPASFIVDMLQKASEMGKSYLFSGLTSVLNSLGLSPDKLSQSSRSSSAMSEPVRLNSGIYVVNKLIRDADDEASSPVCLSRWRSASPVYRHNSRSPHSSPSRSSDRTSYSPKSQRSITMRDSKTKSFGPIKTPDSTDSGTSGRVSEMSDGSQSSPSFKDTQNKENWQSWTEMHNNRNKNSPESNINGGGPVEVNKNGTNEKSIVENHVTSENTSLPTVNGDACNNNGSSSIPSFSLNLHDLSKPSNVDEKRVSFKSSISVSSDETTSPKHSTGTVNGLGNGTDSVFSPQYECPDSMYDEFKYTSMGLYGSMMMMPNLDMSLLFGSEADFQNIKDSLANKFSTGKNIIMRNLKGLEQRILQESKPELLDVKPKSSEGATSPGSHSEIETERSSSEFHSIDRQFWSFLPPIDLSELVEISKTTWLLTRDVNILCDKERLSKSLEKWVNSLHSAQMNVIQAVLTFLQNYQNPGSHSYKDDDTLRSICSQVTSQDSSPSENCEISERLDQEDPSVSDSKSYDDDKHLESTHSLNVEISDSSTLRTESILGKLVNLEDFVFVYNPFKLSSEDHRMLSELTMMCFQMKILGNIHEVREVCSAILKVKEKIEELQKSIDRKDHDMTSLSNHDLSDNLRTSSVLKHSESAQSFHKPHLSAHASSEKQIQKRPLCNQTSDPGSKMPNGDISNVNECSTKNCDSVNVSDSRDSELASFLQNYFHFFDVQRLREYLSIVDQPCYKTWSVMLAGVALLNGPDEFTRKFNSDQTEAAANCLERSFFGPILISHLLKIFKINSTRGVDLCLQRSYHITALDVLYLSKSCDSHPKPFLEYISRILNCLLELQRPKVLDKLLHLDEVRVEWINGALKTEIDVSESLKCICGWPRPGSHLYPWKYSDLLLHIISTSQDTDGEFKEKLFSCGFWSGYLLLVKKQQLNDIHRKLIIQLGDVSLLDADNQLGYLPSDLEEWKEILALYAQSCVATGMMTCLTCNKQHSTCIEFPHATSTKPWNVSLQWETICRVALLHLDSIKVLEILQTLDIPHGAFSSDFYKSVMRSFLLNKQQSALIHRTLTTVGSYLWSRKLKTLSPEARLVFQKEKEKPGAFAAQTPKHKDPTKAGCSYLEEPESHWGVKISLKSVCKVCKMPLTSHLSPSQGGITVYKCGHSYHTACSTEGFCLVCLHSQDDDG